MKNGAGTLLQGFAWAAAGRVIAMVGGFLLTVLLARGLTPVENGQYFLIFSAVVILAGAGAIGVDHMVVRFAAVRLLGGADRGVHAVLLKCLLAACGAALLLCSILLLAAKFLTGAWSSVVVLLPYAAGVAAWVFFAIVQRQLAESFRGLGDVRAATLLGGLRNNGILNALACCVLIAGLHIMGMLTLASAIVAMATASAFVCLAAAAMLLRDYRSRSVATQDAVQFSLANALRQGWPVWLGTLVSALNYMGSAWLVEMFDDSANVALFGVAQRVVMTLMAPMLVINSVLPPVIAQLHAAGKRNELESLVRASSGLGLLAASAVLVGVLVAGKHLLVIAFGVFYEDAFGILVWLCVAQILAIALGAWQVVLPMTGGSRQMLLTSIVALVSQLVLGIALGSRGVMGVTASVCLSVVLTNLVGMFFVRRSIGVSTMAFLSVDSVLNAMRRVRRRLGFANPR
jgi:O-antigen/teichoic acid export membrane protein